jgi:GT2 family glycosyltransferase
MAIATLVIPTWNGRHLLDVCLAALRFQTWRDFAIVVVDNGSTDGTVAWMQECHPAVQVIGNGENRGFAAAVNQGIRASDSRYIVTLNNDTEPEPGWLAALVAAAENEPTVGMCASKMLFADRSAIINSTGICLDRAGIAWDRRGGELDDASEVEPVEVFGPCGGAALYRRAMLDEIGLFDEDFFAYLEDVDLAWRARRAGWRCLFVPTARVFHRHSATSKEGSPFKSYQLGRNKVWLIAKNYPVQRLWRFVPAVLLYDLLAVLFAVITRRDVYALRGRLAALAGVRMMWRQQPTTGDRQEIPFLAPLVAPWRVTRRYRHLTPVCF